MNSTKKTLFYIDREADGLFEMSEDKLRQYDTIYDDDFKIFIINNTQYDVLLKKPYDINAKHPTILVLKSNNKGEFVKLSNTEFEEVCEYFSSVENTKDFLNKYVFLKYSSTELNRKTGNYLDLRKK